jgi:hypothetical protein
MKEIFATFLTCYTMFSSVAGTRLAVGTTDPEKFRALSGRQMIKKIRVELIWCSLPISYFLPANLCTNQA